MRWLYGWMLIAAGVLIIGTMPAFAQNAAPAGGFTGYSMGVPGQLAGQPIPPLPVSRLCTQKDIMGLWWLDHVYESPAQLEAAAFANKPVQYFLIRKNNTFGKFSSRTKVPPPEAVKIMDDQTKPLLQYVINDEGFVYLYQDSVVTDTQACFIVVKPEGPFKKNEMLLMPPQGQSSVRLIRVYAKVGPKPPAKKPPKKGPRR